MFSGMTIWYQMTIWISHNWSVCTTDTFYTWILGKRCMTKLHSQPVTGWLLTRISPLNHVHNPPYISFFLLGYIPTARVSDVPLWGSPCKSKCSSHDHSRYSLPNGVSLWPKPSSTWANNPWPNSSTLLMECLSYVYVYCSVSLNEGRIFQHHAL